jgi:predicted nucleic acid-binding protein
MAPVVIADTGPLIGFAAADLLPVLKALFREVTIAESVRREYRVKPGEDTRRMDAAITVCWLVVRSVPTSSGPLSPGLGLGESDSIRLAIEDPDGSLLILDDRLARRYALSKGLNLVGTVHLLDLAERRGLIASAEASLRTMARFGYRIAPALLERVRAGRERDG